MSNGESMSVDPAVLVVGTNGHLRRLATFRQYKDGSIYINPTRGAFVHDVKDGSRSIGTLFDDPQSAHQETKFSFHPSQRSKKFNIIISRTRDVEKINIKRKYYSNGIKIYKGYIPIFGLWCSSLRGNEFDVPAKYRRFIDLGEFDITRSTLMWSTFISNRSLRLTGRSNHTFPYFHRVEDFGEFSVHILAIFINIPSLPVGALRVGPLMVHEDQDREDFNIEALEVNFPLNSLNEDDVISHFMNVVGIFLLDFQREAGHRGIIITGLR